MFDPGDKIGPYTLQEKLGEGNFGVVWLAETDRFAHPQRVAVKILKQPSAKAILDEVFVWAKTDHPNVLPILEARFYQTRYGEMPVIVSPYIAGGSLERQIGANLRMPITAAVAMLCGILDGLEYLAGRAIVHRDLKPANILLHHDTPLIADFGIARVVNDGPISSIIAGTPLYMAPEAFSGYRSHQTDLWSVSVIGYLLLAGRLPFPNAMAITGDAPPLPLPDSIPPALQKVIAAALRKDAMLRIYKSAAQLRDALRLALQQPGHAVVADADVAAINLPVLPTPSRPDGAADEAPPPALPATPGWEIEIDKVESRDFEITPSEQGGNFKGHIGEVKTKKFVLGSAPERQKK